MANPVKLHPHHVGVFCSNLERSVDWWEEILGFKLMDERTCFLPDYGHARLAWLKLDDFYVELFDFPGLRALDREAYWGTYGTKHLCLTTREEDFDDFLRHLEDKKANITLRAAHPPETTGKPDGDVRVVFVSDPDGNTVEIQTENRPGEDNVMLRSISQRHYE